MRGHRTIGAKNSRSEPSARVESEPRPLGRKLEGDVTDVDTDEVLGDWTGVEPETATPIGPRRERHRSRFVIAAAAVAVAAVLAALIGLAVRRDKEPRSGVPASHPDVRAPGSDGPILLAPPAEYAGSIANEAAHGRSAAGFVRAAARTPSGEVIGMIVPGGLGSGGGGTGGWMMIGRHDVAIGKRRGDRGWSYGITGDIFDVGITTSAGLDTADPWSHLPRRSRHSSSI